ncbi:hypothetical protein AAC387_Pa02g1632 [Persea americana]
MVKAIRSKLMEFFELRWQKSHVLNSRLTRYAESMLSKESEHARRLGVCVANPTKIEVHSSEYVDVVHLDLVSVPIVGGNCLEILARMLLRHLR